MTKATALLRVTTIMLAAAILVSGMNTDIADSDGAELVARKGVADLLVEHFILKN
ncbi:MAG: hypothetical protein AAFU55_16280 [Pseudomonadota bacterium]